MPIDENALNIKINEIAALESRTELLLTRINTAKNLLIKIVMDGENLPLDDGTGANMTDVRRQEIYDACIVEANALLAEDE